MYEFVPFRKLFMLKKESDRVLILQCDSGNEHTQLLACARHHIMNTYQNCQEELQEGEDVEIGKTHIVLVVQLPRQKGGCFVSFQVIWKFSFYAVKIYSN